MLASRERFGRERDGDGHLHARRDFAATIFITPSRKIIAPFFVNHLRGNARRVAWLIFGRPASLRVGNAWQ